MSSEELAEELRLARRELKFARAEQEQIAEQLQRVRRQRARLRDQVDVLAEVLAARLSEDYWHSAAPSRQRRLSRQGRQDESLVSSEEQRMVREVETSAIFDAGWYLRRHLDAARGGLSPAAHYVRIGGPHGDDPSEAFDTKGFLQRNPAALTSSLPPLIYRVRHPEVGHHRPDGVAE